MHTSVLKVNPRRIDKGVIKKAARCIRSGELVAFPTETVYGLGANALDAKAVKKIFKAKGRPSDNPMIVHIGEKKDLDIVARDVPEIADHLAKRFWPGPLTLIFRKSKRIPKTVTGGGDTVAVRVPDNRIAQALIKESGVPLAAPSANISTRPSPTAAEHVFDDLSGKIPLVLDGGKTNIGIESTVLDLTVSPPAILRRGGVSRREIEKVIGKVGDKKEKARVPKSPGEKYKHYTPRATVFLVKGKKGVMKRKIEGLIKRHSSKKRIGVITFFDRKKTYVHADCVFVLGSRNDVSSAAQNIFSFLRIADSLGLDLVLVESLKEEGIGEAVMERVSRAAERVV